MNPSSISGAQRVRLGLIFLILWGALSVARPAFAHEFRPALLSLEERDTAGQFAVRWIPPSNRSGNVDVEPVYPSHCVLTGRRLDCGEEGLRGTLRFDGLAGTNVEVVVQITYADGTVLTEVRGGDDPDLDMTQGIAAGGAGWQLAAAYTTLGFWHILEGYDHLLFVLGLIMVVGYDRKLFWTITAFTLAHSITLATSALGYFSLPSAPVEATIALSILLVASETLHERPTFTRTHPYLVSFGFGLLHGFGFSGALQDIGLPRTQVPLALASFNVGVELGQLSVVLALWLCWKGICALPRDADRMRFAKTVLAYAVGTVAAFWTIERIVGMFFPG